MDENGMDENGMDENGMDENEYRSGRTARQHDTGY